MNSALKNHATYINNKVDTNEISLSQYISTDNILQNKQGIECATSLPIQGGKVTAFKKGDILLANIRPYLKKIWYAQFDGGCSADVLAIRANAETDSHFLFYALFRDDFFIHAMKGAKGTKMPRGDKAQIMEFKIPVFDLKTQQSIASVLSALDKKIALNKQINARLEEMAKTLYDYWFVQFDFPDANGKPYKSSGGDMVFDETLKREIPKGWKSGNILNMANLLGGGTPSKSSSEYWNGNIPFFTPTDCDNSIFILDTADKITDAGLCNSSTRLFKKHSIFITARGSVGRSSITAVPMAMNQSCYAFQAKENVSYTFLFFLIRELIMILEVKATGSVFNSIVSSDIETTDLVIPDEDLIMKFGSFCEPLFNQIETTLKQNHHLTQLRDFLLPMLMNGQVSVAE